MYQEETLTGDELVYDFPGRVVTLKQDGQEVFETEAWGLGDFSFRGRVDVQEKFVHFHAEEMEVTISYREVDLVGGGTGREGIQIESINVTKY